MSIDDKIEKIINKYWHDTDEYYSEYRYDEKDNEYEMSKEIEKFFKSNKIEYLIGYEEGFRSCGYDNDFLAVAWIDNGKLKMKTILLECM